MWYNINNQIYFRFTLISDETLNDPGWKIEDISIVASTGAETDDGNLTPLITRLNQNYPNPFNPETKISFYINKEDFISLKIYNLKGQLINTLVDGLVEPGYFDYIWTGRDHKQQPVPSGIYFYRLKTNSQNHTRKMIMIK